MTTGQLIKDARKKVGMTQKELAEKLGLSPQAIAQWENDLRNPKFETLLKIATALGVAPFELMGDRAQVELMESHDVDTINDAFGFPRDTIREIENPEEIDADTLRRIVNRFDYDLTFAGGAYYLTKENQSYRLSQDQLYDLINNSFSYVEFLCDRLFNEFEAKDSKKPQA